MDYKTKQSEWGTERFDPKSKYSDFLKAIKWKDKSDSLSLQIKNFMILYGTNFIKLSYAHT